MKSIRSFLLISVISIVVLCLVAFSIMTYFEAKHEVEEVYDAQLAQSARIIYSLFIHKLPTKIDSSGTRIFSKPIIHHKTDDNSNEDNNIYVATGHVYESKLAYQLWSDTGELILRSSNAPDRMMNKLHPGYDTVLFNTKKWRTFTLQEAEQEVYLVAAEQLEVRQELVSIITDKIALPFLAGIPVLILILWFFIGKGLSPLLNISHAIKRRSSDNLEQIRMPKLVKELKPIEAALNNLFTQVSASIEREKTFTDDAAHELRTPLATIKVHAQNALKSKNKTDQELSLNLLDQSIEQATRTIDQLLQLARIQSLNANQGKQIIKLDKICRDQIAQLDAHFVAKNQAFEFQCPEHLATFEGNDILIGLLVRNLLENASLYTPEQGNIRLCIDQSPKDISLLIQDSGPGVSKESFSLIFKRFHRENPGSSVGSGLGLSIVSRVSELHNAEIKQFSSSDSVYSGLNIMLTFPIS